MPEKQLDRDLKLQVNFESSVNTLTSQFGISSGLEICLRDIKQARVAARKEYPVDALDSITYDSNNLKLQSINSALDNVEQALQRRFVKIQQNDQIGSDFKTSNQQPTQNTYNEQQNSKQKQEAENKKTVEKEHNSNVRVFLKKILRANSIKTYSEMRLLDIREQILKKYSKEELILIMNKYDESSEDIKDAYGIFAEEMLLRRINRGIDLIKLFDEAKYKVDLMIKLSNYYPLSEPKRFSYLTIIGLIEKLKEFTK